MARKWVRWLAGIGVVAAPMASGLAAEYQCLYGDLVRGIEVRAPLGTGVPCEVVYVKETEEPGATQVLWRAENQAAYCTRRAEELADDLRARGWRCTELGTALPTLRPPASTPDRDWPKVPGLKEATERHLQLLAGSAGSEVRAEIGGLGDLDSDGVDDAAVLFTFEDDGTSHAQYLVAYVRRGERFDAVASRFIGGRHGGVQGGAVEAIEDGEIALHLRVLEDGDLQCCPSGRRTVRLVLQDDRLVSLE